MSSKGPADLIRPEIRSLNAYHVQPAQNMIKLDAMENPWPWPGHLMSSWQEKLSGVTINRYPDPHAGHVKTGLRRVMSVPDELQILLGNGSDEIIQIIAMAMAKPGASLLSVEPAFVMYSMIARFAGMSYIGVPLTQDFELDLNAMLAAVQSHQPAIIFLAQPNNPTGNLFDMTAVRQIIEAAEGLVVLDEAYIAFSDSDMLPLASEYPNVVVMRTLSKVGLAGLRLGMLFGRDEWLNEFDKVRLPYNINSLTQLSAEFALDNFAVLAEQSSQIVNMREQLQTQLTGLNGIKVFYSKANFVLVRVPEGKARAIFEFMKAQGILIKCLHGAHPLLTDCLRLTVGEKHENEKMVVVLTQALQEV